MVETKVTEYRFPKGMARVHGDPPKRDVLEQACLRLIRASEKAKREKEAQSKAS